MQWCAIIIMHACIHSIHSLSPSHNNHVRRMPFFADDRDIDANDCDFDNCDIDADDCDAGSDWLRLIVTPPMM